MTTPYDELARLADAAIDADGSNWFSDDQLVDDGYGEVDSQFIERCSPSTIKAMHADLVKARADRDALAEALVETRLRLRSALSLAKCDDEFIDGQCAEADAALARLSTESNTHPA